jgi:hypothetical protein
MGYYIHRDGQSVGVTVDQLREQARAGQLKREDYVYQDETAQWTSAGTMAELAQDWPGATPPPPPPPPAYQPPPAQPQPPAYQAPPTYAQAPQQAYQQQSSQQRPSTSGGVSVDGIDVIFKRSFDMYLQHWQALLLTCAVVIVPLSILSAGLNWLILLPTRAVLSVSPYDPRAGLAAVGVGIVAVLLGLVATLVTSLIMQGIAIPLTRGAVMAAVADLMLGGNGDFKKAWGTLGRKFGPLFITLLLAGLVVAVGTLMLVVPGLVASFLFAMVAPVVLIEGVTGVEALKRSVKLVSADWLRILIVMIVLGLLTAILSWFPAMLLALIFGSAPFLSQVLGDLLMMVILPLPTIALVLLYFDIRRKHEGLDEASLARKLV